MNIGSFFSTSFCSYHRYTYCWSVFVSSSSYCRRLDVVGRHQTNLFGFPPFYIICCCFSFFYKCYLLRVSFLLLPFSGIGRGLTMAMRCSLQRAAFFSHLFLPSTMNDDDDVHLCIHFCNSGVFVFLVLDVLLFNECFQETLRISLSILKQFFLRLIAFIFIKFGNRYRLPPSIRIVMANINSIWN